MLPGGYAPDPAENLAENYQPEDWLDSTRKELSGITEEFLQFRFSYRNALSYEGGKGKGVTRAE